MVDPNAPTIGSGADDRLAVLDHAKRAEIEIGDVEVRVAALGGPRN